MCRAREMNFSTKISSLPKALSDSRRAASKASAKSLACWTTRIPRPPPPWAALRMTGNLSDSAVFSPSAASAMGLSLPPRTGTPTCLSDGAGRDLVSQLFQQVGPRADEDDACVPTCAGELRILRKEAVAGMDRVDFALSGQSDDVVDVQVSLQRLARLAHGIRFVRLEAVEGVTVFVRVDRDRTNAQFMGAAKHADCNLTAVGDEQSANWLHGQGGAPEGQFGERGAKRLRIAPVAAGAQPSS